MATAAPIHPRVSTEPEPEPGPAGPLRGTTCTNKPGNAHCDCGQPRQAGPAPRESGKRQALHDSGPRSVYPRLAGLSRRREKLRGPQERGEGGRCTDFPQRRACGLAVQTLLLILFYYFFSVSVPVSVSLPAIAPRSPAGKMRSLALYNRTVAAIHG